MSYIIFLLSSCFYLYAYILQLVPSVMSECIMKTFNIDSLGLSIMSSLYFYAYASMQLPVGLLFDRYGPRKLLNFSIFLCCFGSLLISITNRFYIVVLGRLIIGIASSFSFIGTLILISNWFSKEKFSILIGISQLMSSIGAIFGGIPVAILTHNNNWKNINLIFTYIGLFLFFLIFIFIHDYPKQYKKNIIKNNKICTEWKKLLYLVKKPNTWIISIYSCFIWTPIIIFSTLWGIPYLQQKYNIDVVYSSSLCTMVWLGIGLGSPILCWISDLYYSRKFALYIGSIFGILSTLILLYSSISISWIYLVLFVLGLSAGGQALSFIIVKDINSNELIGTAYGINNFAVLLGGIILHPIIGTILHYSNPLKIYNKVPIYSIQIYNKVFMIMPICFIISLFAIYFLYESHPKSKYIKNKLS